MPPPPPKSGKKQKDSLSKKGKGGPTFETEEMEDEVVEWLQGLPQIYDKAHRMHMMSCFHQIHPSLWEKYLDESHPLIRQVTNKSRQLREDEEKKKEKPQEREVEICIVPDAAVLQLGQQSLSIKSMV